MDCIDPVSNGCYGSHRMRPWHWALGYCTKAGSYYQGFAPVRGGEGPWSNTRIRDGELRVCEVHAERLREYTQYVQTPSGGQASSAVELALVADGTRHFWPGCSCISSRRPDLEYRPVLLERAPLSP